MTLTFPFQTQGKPFFPVGGQTHNSSGYNLDEMAWAWRALEACNANSFAVPVYWSQVEPIEGQLDFSAIESIIDEARRRNLRMAILWFASWKNGKSRYTPAWVKRDPTRFVRSVGVDGREIVVLSPHCQATLDADRRAFCALIEWLKAKDADQQTVYTVQIENEPGLFGTDRDYSPLGDAALAKAVPAELIEAMRAHPESRVTAIWAAQGSPSSGNWETLFGWDGGEFCTAYALARYIDQIAEAGRAIYDIPYYVNVWLGEHFFQTPGTYPSGGAVAKTLDIWKWSAPNLALIAPDIYVPDTDGYRFECAAYSRQDNPLYIPESPRAGSNAWHMFSAVGDYDCIGVHAFGIEDVVHADGSVREDAAETVQSLRCLREVAPILPAALAKGRVYAVSQEENQGGKLLDLGAYWGMVMFMGGRFGSPPYHRDYRNGPAHDNSQRGRGLIIRMAQDDFYAVGAYFRVLIVKKRPHRDMLTGTMLNIDIQTRLGNYEIVQEGHLDDDGVFHAIRERNGDETDHGIWVTPDVGVVRVVMVD